MRKIIFLLLLSADLLSAQVSLTIYALTNVTLIDANHKTALADQTVIIKDQIIYQVYSGNKKLADSIPVFNLKGKFLLPGFIDTHVHLATDPSAEPRSQKEPILKEMLYAGVTSVRDMAGDGRMLAGLSRDALAGDIVSPNIYYAAVMAGTDFFKDNRTKTSSKGVKNGTLPFMRAISDSSDLNTLIVEARGSGASGIKLYEQLSAGLVQKVVDAAAKQQMKVWGHAATFPAMPYDVVNAGVSVISHSEMLYFGKYTKKTIPKEWETRENPDKSNEFWDEEVKKLELDSLFILMKKKGTILDATQSVYVPMVKKNPKLRWKGEISMRITKKAYEAGVKICTGTDTEELFAPEEAKLLVKFCGLSPADAIVAATLHGAEAIGIEKTHGTIEVHKIADLVVLNKNPLEDIRNINAVYMVIKSGQLYKKN